MRWQPKATIGLHFSYQTLVIHNLQFVVRPWPTKSSLLGKPAGAGLRVNPLAAKPPNFAPKAKSVIFLFMVGGPSHIDTFDPKLALERYEGQKLPDSYGKVVSQFTAGDTPLLASPWKFSPPVCPSSSPPSMTPA